jgi:predicted dehydrogenase
MLGVGMIGLNADRGWAQEAHAPAVLAVDGLALAGVATRRPENAAAAALRFGTTSFPDAEALIADERIDVVAVVSAVPTHRALIMRAVEAGKHVLTEWPVAVGTEQTEAIAKAAGRAGVVSAVGLQTRRNPAVLQAARLLGEGRIGRLLSVRVLATTAAFGPVIDASTAPLEEASTGMNLTTIHAAHALDLVAALAGPIVAVQATRGIQYPVLTSARSPERLARTLPDHVLIQGRLAADVLAVVEVVGGRPAAHTPFRMEMQGTEGSVVLSGGAPRGFQAGSLELFVDGRSKPVDDRGLPDPVLNVAGVYSALRDDIENGTRTAPTFDDALRLSALIDAVIASDVDGRRVTL